MDFYTTVDGEARAEYEIKHSLFISAIRGITDYADGAEFVKRVSKQYSDATHNCYAILCRSGEQKFSDDGEPSGTAGMPILQTLKKSDLTDVACVVTRYFGGIKLGAGGLVSAYTKAAALAIEGAKTALMKKSNIYGVTVPYGDYDALLRITASCSGRAVDISYGQDVYATLAIPVDRGETFNEKICEAFAGKTAPALLKTEYKSY